MKLEQKDLYKICPTCQGQSYLREKLKGQVNIPPCVPCENSGIILEDAGKVLKDFIEQVNLRFKPLP